jgi:hypothetical protein
MEKLKPLISLKEYIEINNLCESFDSTFTDEQIELADMYSVKFNEVSQVYSLTLYNVAGDVIGTVDYPDPDILMAFIEETFDIEDDVVEVDIENSEDQMFLSTSNYGMGQDLRDTSAAAITAASNSHYGALVNPSVSEPTLGSSDMD